MEMNVISHTRGFKALFISLEGNGYVELDCIVGWRVFSDPLLAPEPVTPWCNAANIVGYKTPDGYYIVAGAPEVYGSLESASAYYEQQKESKK